ncbi:MAG TPA: peroxide stress protein YaaA [Tangfeifania sp.]|nr:peroxide stress protein YaaA [Tangfeifania sp.]
MLIVISPAKSLDFDTKPKTKEYTLPELLGESEKLVEELKQMSPDHLSKLMGISKDLAELNFQRFQTWHLPFTPENAKQAVLTFSGEVFRGLDANSLPAKQLKQAQKKLRILSGLYGVLKPLDLIQPYRLEMGTKLKSGEANNLYEFWNPQLSEKVREAVEESGSGVLINLASKEYFKSIDTKILRKEIITPEFRDMKNGHYKIISVYAKKARGMMTRFIIENDIKKVTDLQAFDMDGYNYNPGMSKTNRPVFTRG